MAIDGWFTVIFASFLWSLTPAFVSRYRASIDPIIFNGLRAFSALFIVVPLAMYLNSFSHELSFYYMFIALVASIGPLLGDIFYLSSIKLIGGSIAAAVSYTYIFITQILSSIVIGNTPSIGILLGSIIAFLGIAVVSMDISDRYINRKDSRKGLVYGFITAICWGIGTILVRIALDFYDIASLTLIRLVFIFIVLTLPRIRIAFKMLMNRNVVIPLMVSGTIGWGIGMLLFTFSVSSIGPNATALGSALTPVLTVLSTRIVAKERITIRLVVGVLLVAIGIAMAMSIY